MSSQSSRFRGWRKHKWDLEVAPPVVDSRLACDECDECENGFVVSLCFILEIPYPYWFRNYFQSVARLSWRCSFDVLAGFEKAEFEVEIHRRPTERSIFTICPNARSIRQFWRFWSFCSGLAEGIPNFRSSLTCLRGFQTLKNSKRVWKIGILKSPNTSF